MEKKVYLLTCTCFSKSERGVDYMHAVGFENDAEIAVFKSKKDAFACLLKRVENSKIVGWVVSSNGKFFEMVHPSYSWRMIYKVTEKTIF